MDEKILRIVDANSNRTREALRVVEDVIRFYREDAQLTARLKDERHRIATYCDRLLKYNFKGLKARDTRRDPGRDSMSAGERKRGGWNEILISNFRRAEESLRVLEEVTKLVDSRLSRLFKRSRFRVYDLEKSCVRVMERKIEKH